jgi:transcriptional regulator with XRE-family HTH domain
MIIGDRLRALREEKHLSQGQIEKRSGLLCCYISRVEHGYTIPSVETLEKMCRALEVPLYQLFYDGKNPPILPKYKAVHKTPSWGSSGKQARLLAKFCHLLSRTRERDRELLLHMARRLARTRAA